MSKCLSYPLRISLTHDGRVSNRSFSWLWRCTTPDSKCCSPYFYNVMTSLNVLLHAVVILFAVLLCQGSLNRNVAFCHLNNSSLMWKSNSWCFGVFFPCLIRMDELSFHLQFNWFRPLKAKAFLPAQERQELEMKCEVEKSRGHTFIPAWPLEVLVGRK